MPDEVYKLRHGAPRTRDSASPPETSYAMTLSVLSLVLPTSVLYGISLARLKACLCLYGDSCWPSDSHFLSLAAQVSQPLIQPLPPASACYPIASPQGNCSEVMANWDDGNWRANQTGAMQSSNFETYIFSNNTIAACYLNTTLVFPCSQGSVPIIGVDARSSEDVQAAVKFVAKHNLRLVVKNTGYKHEVHFRSSSSNTLLQSRLPWSERSKRFLRGMDTQHEEH